MIDLAGVDCGAHLRGIGLEQSGFAGHLDTFGKGADLQSDIDARPLVDFERESGVDVGLKAFGFNC